jgi:Rieske 2Fe-2S family protein
MDQPAIEKLIDQRRPGHGLPRAFYTSAAVFEREVEAIFLNAWLYACHESEVPNTGDYQLLEFAGESLILMRGEDHRIHGLINVCRHRGSRVCLASAGSERSLVCRYHGWTYGLDGSLKGAPQMPADFQPAEHGLKTVHVRLIEGLVMVNFAADPVPFDALDTDMAQCLSPYQLADARVARRSSYPIAANWKLAMENYCECYHCRPSHPEYSQGHALAQPRDRWCDRQSEVDQAAVNAGLNDNTFDRTWLDAGQLGIERQHERYPLNAGHLSGSDDGQPVAPLMGKITEFVAAATDIQLGPTLFGLAYCDHVVLYRFLPVNVDQTLCDVSWLVRGDAQAGSDYDPDRLTWLWDVTTLADQRIIENNAKGVRSRFYEPGPFSNMEKFADRFVQWYLAAVGDSSAV